MSQSESLNRAAKARKLADVLQAHDATAAQVAELDEVAWASAATLAGVKMPSEATRGVVVALLADRTQTDDDAEALFRVEDFDIEGISYVGRMWRTTEANAREFFAKHYEGSTLARLIGRGGSVLA